MTRHLHDEPFATVIDDSDSVGRPGDTSGMKKEKKCAEKFHFSCSFKEKL
jgi:hypothetical protein